jgi:hypothetical protein
MYYVLPESSVYLRPSTQLRKMMSQSTASHLQSPNFLVATHKLAPTLPLAYSTQNSSVPFVDLLKLDWIIPSDEQKEV